MVEVNALHGRQRAICRFQRRELSARQRTALQHVDVLLLVVALHQLLGSRNVRMLRADVGPGAEKHVLQPRRRGSILDRAEWAHDLRVRHDDVADAENVLGLPSASVQRSGVLDSGRGR